MVLGLGLICHGGAGLERLRLEFVVGIRCHIVVVIVSVPMRLMGDPGVNM